MGTVAGKECQKGEESVDLTFPPSSSKGTLHFGLVAKVGLCLVSTRHVGSSIPGHQTEPRSPLFNGEGDPRIGHWTQIALEREFRNFEFQHF